MIYKLRNETYDDDELEAMTREKMDLLRADCKAERATVELEIKEKQLQYKKGIGPGASPAENAERELEIAEIKTLEFQLEYLLLARAPAAKK